jgi:hypothetical protein
MSARSVMSSLPSCSKLITQAIFSGSSAASFSTTVRCAFAAGPPGQKLVSVAQLENAFVAGVQAH